MGLFNTDYYIKNLQQEHNFCIRMRVRSYVPTCRKYVINISYYAGQHTSMVRNVIVAIVAGHSPRFTLYWDEQPRNLHSIAKFIRKLTYFQETTQSPPPKKKQLPPASLRDPIFARVSHLSDNNCYNEVNLRTVHRYPGLYLAAKEY